MEHPRIETPCPACGHRTLFIGAGGHLVCSWLKCQEPGLERVITHLKRDVRRMDDLVLWLLGEQGDFPSIPDDFQRRKFYWRSELRKRFEQLVALREVPEAHVDEEDNGRAYEHDRSPR